MSIRSFTQALTPRPNIHYNTRIRLRNVLLRSAVLPFKVTFPRSDLKVKVDDVIVETGLALTGWLAFKPHGDETMMMGELR
ncbi:DUF1259 domain-containing protein [Paenibacillus thiaminolyticus]|uniref:DUF1259 domain-containing protein n=1 Tax=Paenibacillus thiaminolyticus TaxID=49283 RepID=UPI0035A59479